jgi:hypothetical protein
MDVLKLSDGSTEIVGSIEDFSDLLDKKLGVDARDWFDDLVAINTRAFSDLYTQLETYRVQLYEFEQSFSELKENVADVLSTVEELGNS